MSRVICVDYKTISNSNAWKGVATLYVEKTGYYVRRCRVFQKGTRRWVTFPCQGEIQENGEKEHILLVEFKDKKWQKEFLILAMKAVDSYCFNQGNNSVFEN